MDDQGGNINLTLLSWRQKYRMIVVQVVCLVVYYYIIRKRSQDRMIERTLTLEKDRVRAKIMKQIDSSEGRKIIRMGPKAFLDLCDFLKREGGLQQEGTVGRVLYSAPIRLWAPSAVLASFETTFTFSISRPGNNPPADGLAFFIARHDTAIPPGSNGGQLGLFSNSLAINNSRNEIVGFKASPDQVVAVEFDTYLNPGLGDPNYKHVGIDVNSIRSKVTAAWGWQNGGIATAHISYNSLSARLSAATYYPNSNPVTVSYDVKLNEVLPQWVRVGFSASTGDYSQQSTLLSWSFSSSLKTKDAAEADDDGHIASVV